MLRFDIAGLGPNPTSLPEPGSLGVSHYVFMPRRQLVPTADLAAHLLGLEKPVLLAPLSAKGLIGAWWADGLDPRARAVWDHTFANQRSALIDMVGALALADDEPLLLETGAETQVFPATVLRKWAVSYAINIGWRVDPLTGDDRARARLWLIANDGRRTPGDACGQRPRPE